MLIHEIDDVKEWISIYIHTFMYICIYCILHGRIKGFNRSITTILFEVGSYRTVVG